RGQDLPAEAFFARSLAANRTVNALNNLAWLLQKRGEYGKAEEYVREALRMDAGIAQTWDTLGVILMKTGRQHEAKEAFERSLELSDENVNVKLHLAELHIAMGEASEAEKVLRRLTRIKETLSSDDAETLVALSKSLKKLQR
ncbi:MAG: tetratricopeptide repeat protein, partial [Lentisphaerae bacterium]|nr:tetratricopeptide repeat protein [Lentisphaerota bacterium]